MNDSVSLGRIRGIHVGVNWSVLVLTALLVWTLAAVIFPESVPDLAPAAYLVMALIGAALFLVSILLHELGHALQARREGLPIDGITLWLFGGVARFRGGFPSAGAEFRIAIAGPLVSLALGVVFIGLAFVPGVPLAVAAVVGYIGSINLLLLAFNMIPALPLDGGRVLRSALWFFRGDFVQATRWSAAVGRVLAIGLIVLGVFMLVRLNSFGGAWLAVIGWFVFTAASSESRASLARAALEGLRVRDLMARPVAASADQTLGVFMDNVAWIGRHSSYPVIDRTGAPIGVVAFSEIVETPEQRREWVRVRERMQPLADVAVVGPNDDLIEAAEKLGESKLGRAFVVDRGVLVGLLTPADLERMVAVRQTRPKSPPAPPTKDPAPPYPLTQEPPRPPTRSR